LARSPVIRRGVGCIAANDALAHFGGKSGQITAKQVHEARQQGG